MNLLTPTFIYCPAIRNAPIEQIEGQTSMPRVQFPDISISYIQQITVAGIFEKYKELQGVENIELGKLRIWIVVLNNNLDFQTLNLESLKEDVKKIVGVCHIEFNCMILSNEILKTSNPIIQTLQEYKKWLNYTVLLNNNNLSWVRTGSQIISTDNLLLNYGLKLIERLHYTNYFVGDLCDTFNNTGRDKYLLTIGSSILPQDLIIEKREEKEIYQLSEIFIEQNKVFWNLINNLLKAQTNQQQRKQIDNGELKHSLSAIFNVINNFSSQKQEGTDEENKVQKDKRGFFKTLYSELNIENSYISPYINHFKLQHYVAVIEELFSNQLYDFVHFLDSDLSNKQLLIERERKLAFSEKIKDIRLPVFQPNNKEKRSAQYVLNQAEPKVSKQIKEWLLENDFEEEELSDGSIIDRITKNIGQIRIEARGLTGLKGNEENPDFVRLVTGRIIKEQERDIANNIRNNDLKVLLTATLKKKKEDEVEKIYVYKNIPVTNADIRIMLSTLSNLKAVMPDNRKFDIEQFRKKSDTLFKAKFATLQTAPKFNECLSSMVEIFIEAHNAAVENGKEEIKIKYIPETEPFFCCSSSLEHSNRIKQFIFVNQAIQQNGNEVLEYVENNLYANESLSIYGPWTEIECLSV